MEWLVRSYEVGDEHAILDLFYKVFGKKMSLAFWKWRFVDNPFGKGIIKLCFDDKKLIGHYAVTPMSVYVANNYKNAVFSMTTMTHPDYRGKGIFAMLANEVYNECGKRGYSFVYGFPNENSYKGFIEKLGWKGFGNMHIWFRDMKDNAYDLRKHKNIMPIENFDGNVDLLWETVKQKYVVAVPRNKEFLNWRFVRNPEVTYWKFAFREDTKIQGYIVLKKHPMLNEGHIVDILSVEDKKVVESLLSYAYWYFATRGIQRISCWCPEDSFLCEVLKNEGFVKRKMERTYFGVKVFSNDLSLEHVEDFANWHLMMGDSDVF